MEVRKSRVLRKLRSGEVAVSFGACLGNSRIAEIAAMSGFDCLWIEMEHMGTDWSVTESIIKAAKIYDVDTLVRVSRGSYNDYIKAFELDATGIMVPHVMNLDDAKEIIKMTRFHPIGRRPIDGGYADACYGNIEIEEYIKQANEQRFIILQIEDFEAMEYTDAICALEGVDLIFLGPLDYSHSIGLPGKVNHPKVLEANKRVLESTIAHGKYAFASGGSLDNFRQLVNMGYKFIHVGADTTAINVYCQKIMQTIRNEVERK